jgi:hypothetical protein
MRVRRPLNRLCASLSIAALLVSGPARADNLDIAIKIVAPELASKKAVLKCAIGGKKLQTCAEQLGLQVLDETVISNMQEIVYIGGLADNKDWSRLVTHLGVVVACTAFPSAAGGAVCGKFAGTLVKSGEFAINAGPLVVKEVGGAVGKLIESGLVTLSCAIGFGCPQEADPTKYTVDLGAGNGAFTIDKWDLAEVWKIDYAARMGEGIKARISDPKHLARMIASDPPTRFLNVVYSYDDDALGSISVHKREKQMRDEGAGDVNQTGLFPRAFMPYGKEFNARWIVMVNKATADSLEDTAKAFKQNSKNYMEVVLPELSDQYFDTAAPALKGWSKKLIDMCRVKVDDPARALPMWLDGATLARDDGSYSPRTRIPGITNIQLTKVKDWCHRTFRPILEHDVITRRVAYFKAQDMGCERKENGERGLNCTAEVGSGNFSLISGGLKQCYIAYRHLAKKYCKGIVPRAQTPTEPDAAILEIKPKQTQPIDDADIPLQNGSVLGKKKVPRKAVPIEPDLQQTEQSNQPDTQVLVPLKPIQTRPVLAAAKSTLCHFTSGPRADQTQDYAPMAPIPVGSSCQDARGSFGIVVAQ